MHKSLRLPGSTEIPLVRTVRDPIEGRPRVLWRHLLFRLLLIGLTDTHRFN